LIETFDLRHLGSRIILDAETLLIEFIDLKRRALYIVRRNLE